MARKYFGFAGRASSSRPKAGDSFDGSNRQRRTGLAEWFQENSIPVKLLDLDTDKE
jgi:hypothetical protein